MVKGSTKRASKGKTCLGVFRSPLKCTLARNKSGAPIVLCRNCVECGEQRCKAHCKCARTGSDKAKGRSGSRGYTETAAQSRARVNVQATSPALVAAPVGRAAPLTCSLLDTNDWYNQCCSDLGVASEVELASYVYDHPAVHQKLLQRLRGRRDFTLNVYVDQEQFSKGAARHERGRLCELLAAGANVYMCKGRRGRGSYHCKALVVDRRYLYTGNANLTLQSTNNHELVFKMTGPPVRDVLERLAQHRVAGKLWSGV